MWSHMQGSNIVSRVSLSTGIVLVLLTSVGITTTYRGIMDWVSARDLQ